MNATDDSTDEPTDKQVSSSPSRLKNQVRIIINLPWHRVVSAWILIVLLSFYTVLSLIGINADLIDNVCISFWSTGYLLLVPFVLLLPVAQKKCWSALGIFPICVLIIWQLASIELYGVQRQFLSWHELWDLISSSHTIVFVYSELLSVTVLVFIVFFYGVYYLLEYGFRKYDSKIAVWVVISLPLFLYGYGNYRVTDEIYFSDDFRDSRLCCMPWCRVSDTQRGVPVALPHVAREAWYVNNTMLIEGADPAIAKLKNLYPHRNIVVVIMESHGLNNVDVLGQSGLGHIASSPYLYELAEKNLCFYNYFESGFWTKSAVWSILSGFQYFHESTYTP
ncbi:MAG: hypothetical protein HRU15_15085, partial [Planctomycetes bacterium]|nr:hypothetical protein [Planctomycetota bacterium]